MNLTKNMALGWSVCRRMKNTIKASNSDIRFVSRIHMVGNRDFNLGFKMAMKRAVQGVLYAHVRFTKTRSIRLEHG